MQAFKRLRKMRNMESDQSTTSLVDSTEMISFTLQDTTPSVNAEQLELRPMRRKPRETILELLLDFFFIALSLPSLLYALSVMYYDSTPVHEHERMANLFIQISRIGPTVLPLAFAAVIGRTVKAYTVWRLEKGERLGSLDTLAGSATLVSTIMNQASLRVFTLLGVVLTLVWMLSPVAGQAALRTISLANVTSSTNASFNFPKSSHDSLYGTGGLFLTATSATEKGMAQALYASSLMSAESVKQSSVDLWGNIKVPYIETMEHNASRTADAEGWYTLGDEMHEVASLVGIPVFNLSAGASNSSFTMNASYWYIHCPSVSNDTEEFIPTSLWQGALGKSSVGLWSNNTEIRGEYRESRFPSDLSARNIFFRAYIVSSFCQISTSYVDLKVECQSEICHCAQIRRSVEQHWPANWTYLDITFNGLGTLMVFESFANWFANLVPGHSYTFTIVEGYFQDPGQPMRPRSSTKIGDLPTEVFSLRLAQVLNTAWFASWIYSMIGLTDLDPDAAVTVSGVQTTATEQIRCNYLWFSILLLASLVMLSAAVACAVFRMLRRGPEFDLLFSTMVKEDPNVSLPAMNTTLSAVERARRCKDVKVILGDVCGEDDVGHIALSNAGGSNVIGLSKDRLYD